MSVQDLFGIELPILQAPMAGVQGSALAIAVCNAGGLGALPCAMLGIEAMRREIATIAAHTDKPFNVNFFCHTPPVVDAGREQRWRDALAPYYAEFDLDITAIPPGPARAPFDAAAADVLDEFKPAVVSFHFGLPAPHLLARAKACGAKILSSATTVEEAVWLEAAGVDAVIAQGLEAGGHRGDFLSGHVGAGGVGVDDIGVGDIRPDDASRQMGTFALLPRIVRAVRVPVIAAGGIADARGVAAAMALGAAGVQIGTAYLLCPEATTSAVHRAALASDAARHTALTNIFSGRLARGIVNRVMRELGPISKLTPEFPLAAAAMAPLRASAEREGSGDFSPLWAGQNVGGCKEADAAQLTRDLARGSMDA
ncbi:MAG TPA: nitronate monooxygenase [Xanthomonadaceae bacterium]|jgi:nitronate monooxygenase